jgi:Zn-dependent protease with chaperone function
MEVYRETRTVARPPAAVATAVFGDGDARRRTATRAGLYHVETTFDPAAGTLRTSVAVPGLAGLVALAVLLALLGVGTPRLRLLSLWLAAAAVVVPLGHLLPWLDAGPAVGRVTDRRVSPVTAPAFAAAVGSLWLTLAPVLAGVAAVFCAVVALVGAACYAVGAGWRTAAVSSLWLPAAGLVPILSTLGGYAVVLAVAEQGATVAARAGVAVAALSIGFVVGYSALLSRAVATARFEPLDSRSRRLTFAGYLAVVALLGTVFVGLAGRVLARHGPVLTVVLAAPLAIPAGGWLVSVTRSALARLAAVRRADTRTVEGVTLYVVPGERPHVTATMVPRGVVTTRAVLDTLAEDELAAVVVHERHHIAARGWPTRVVLEVAAMVVGRNPVAAFLGAPARERTADRYAVAHTGAGSLVGALRRLERLEPGARPSPSPIAAPYAVLYGRVPDAAIYPSVDERIAAVTERH